MIKLLWCPVQLAHTSTSSSGYLLPSHQHGYRATVSIKTWTDERNHLVFFASTGFKPETSWFSTHFIYHQATSLGANTFFYTREVQYVIPMFFVPWTPNHGSYCDVFGALQISWKDLVLWRQAINHLQLKRKKSGLSFLVF